MYITGNGVDSTILSASDGTTTAQNAINIYSEPQSLYTVYIQNLTITNAAECIRAYGTRLRLGNIKFGPHFAVKSGVDIRLMGESNLQSTGASGSNVT